MNWIESFSLDENDQLMRPGNDQYQLSMIPSIYVIDAIDNC